MNNVYTIGPLYWILRDTGTKETPRIAMGFLRQARPPWRTGRGVQVCIGKFVLQIGLCRKPKNIDTNDELSGLLYAMQARVIDSPVAEIGDWK
jgi:hypothetical protein